MTGPKIASLSTMEVGVEVEIQTGPDRWEPGVIIEVWDEIQRFDVRTLDRTTWHKVHRSKVRAPKNALTSAGPVAEDRAAAAGPVESPATRPGRSTSEHEDARPIGRLRSIADALASARDELLANSTPVEPGRATSGGEGAGNASVIRAEIARIIASERAAAEVGARDRTDALRRARNVEAAWRHLYPGLAALHDDGHAALSVVLPVGLLGGLLVLLAGPARLIKAIPVTPTPNGLILPVILGLGIAFGWRRLARIKSADEPPVLDELKARRLHVMPADPRFGIRPADERQR